MTLFSKAKETFQMFAVKNFVYLVFRIVCKFQGGRCIFSCYGEADRNLKVRCING